MPPDTFTVVHDGSFRIFKPTISAASMPDGGRFQWVVPGDTPALQRTHKQAGPTKNLGVL